MEAPMGCRGGSTEPHRRNRRAILTMVRSSVSIVLMVWIYYLAPLEGSFHWDVAIWLALGLFALGIAIAWQIRAIVRSPIPRVRAIEAFALILPALLLLYAAVYAEISLISPASFTE